MSIHTADEVRKKRLARLDGGSHTVPSENRQSPIEIRNEFESRVSDSDFLMEVEGESLEPTCYNASSVPLAAEENTNRSKFCDPFPHESQLSPAKPPFKSLIVQSFDPHATNMRLLLRILCAHLKEAEPDKLVACGADEQVEVNLPQSMRPNIPPDVTDIRYYKSICFDLLSSALYQIRSAYVDALSHNVFEPHTCEYFLLEYLCQCIHRVQMEKDSLIVRGLDLTSSLTLELLDELRCQLHSHIRLTLFGLYSVLGRNGNGLTPIVADPWISGSLHETPLLRLTAPHLLPPHMSLWALGQSCAPGHTLDTVITADLLEPPVGTADVLYELLNELQRELSSTKSTSQQCSRPNSLQMVFRQLLMTLHFRIRWSSFNRQDYTHVLGALVALSNTTMTDGARPINQLLVNLPCWRAPLIGTNSIQGRCVERLSYLGPFFSASVFADDDPTVVESAFTNVNLTDTEIQHTTQALQLSYDLIWNQQFALVKSLLSKATRLEMLDYLTEALLHNANHGKIHCDQRLLSGEGFMLNMAVLFQRLSAPINVDSVDPRYLFHRTCRVNWDDATCISGTREELTAFKLQLANEWEREGSQAAHQVAFNFSTECFFLAAWSMQLGFQNSIRRYHRRLQVITDLTRNIKLLSASRGQWAGSNSSAARILMNEGILERWKSELNRHERSKLCCDVALLHRGLLQSVSVYYSSLCKLLFRVAKVQPHLGLSTSTTPPDLFAFMPEVLLEDIANYLIFILRHFPTNSIPIDPTAQPVLVAFVLFIICHAHFVRNPYLVAKFVEVLFYCDPSVGGRPNDFHNATKLHALATSHLISALIQYYIAVESTGSTNEFYDKFSIRYNISTILITWWREGFLKSLFIREAETNEQNFIKFTNRVINDMSFLLEEALDGLKKVRELQDLRDDSARWAELPRQQQISRMGELEQHERQVRSYLTLANQTVSMLSHLTSEIRNPFLRPEIVDKLAAMLNFNLVQLCGPRCSSLKVRNPESYGWAPKTLLAQLVSIYRHLDSDDNRFALALSKDERCFSKSLFENACTLMSRHGIQTPEELDRFARLGAKADELARTQAEVDYGEIPAEFCDTLISTLMDDPVMLPQSQAIVDRSTIVQHLLNQETDPFNRMPLREDELIPLPDLKKRIAEWKAERETKWRACQQSQADGGDNQ